VIKHNFDQTPKLLETFDQLIRSSEIRSSDHFPSLQIGNCYVLQNVNIFVFKIFFFYFESELFFVVSREPIASLYWVTLKVSTTSRQPERRFLCRLFRVQVNAFYNQIKYSLAIDYKNIQIAELSSDKYNFFCLFVCKKLLWSCHYKTCNF
jgi:hypothetical protein